MENLIKIRGAKTHNLKNIDLDLPKNKLIVITGLSGSGKSSLAFDTIYAEGQRRYVESLSSYARQFLGQMDKPDVKSIEGLSPAISIDQKTTSHNPRSTVGTVTEIYDYLRLLFANIGIPHCPKCKVPIEKNSIDQIIDSIMSLEEKSKIIIISRIIDGKKGNHKNILEKIRKDGYTKVRIDDVIYDIDDAINLDKNKKHTIDIVVDRIILKEGILPRLTESVEAALKIGNGVCFVQIVGGEFLRFSEHFACNICNFSMENKQSRDFSFNSPYGACPDCYGLGTKQRVDTSLVISDEEKSLNTGLFESVGKSLESYTIIKIKALLEKFSYDENTKWKDIKKDVQDILLFGSSDEKFHFEYTNPFGEHKEYYTNFEGIVPIIERRFRESNSDVIKENYEFYLTNDICTTCNGKRLKKEVLSILIDGKNIADVCDLSIDEGILFFSNLTLKKNDEVIAKPILEEVIARLNFLKNVGLTYLSLNRSANSLSGGEAQRIRLATQIGSGLTGVLYILDEPSIGLHQADNDKLLQTLKKLKNLGNTLIIVEHDEDTIRFADYVVDIGPMAGIFGGEVVASGTPLEIEKKEDSITGNYLSKKRFIKIPKKRRKGNGKYITIKGAKVNNLKNINVKFPLGTFTCVTGASGSGKSSLVNEILYKTIAKKFYKTKLKPGEFKEIEGIENIDKIINIDQSPIGRTPRSNPATYIGLFDLIRDLFSKTPDAKMKGYKPGRFSFNVKGGRCESCQGDGIIKIEMHFLPDVYVECDVCNGKRYNRETLEVKYKGKTIADILNMSVDDAFLFFANQPKIMRYVSILKEMGLGYIKLGQSATTLSGGEAQRIKLASELVKRSTSKTLYILDEPTTGLHIHDVNQLLIMINKLVDQENTVVVIEHNLDIIKQSDYIIDLGPLGGKNGGKVIAKGTPEKIAQNENSLTGKYLKKILEDGIYL